MTRAIGPKTGLPPEAATPFTVLALCWLPVAAAGCAWVGGRTASLFSGHGWQGPAFGWEFAVALTEQGGVERLWPGTSPLLIAFCTTLTAAAVAAPLGAVVLIWSLRRRPPGDPLPSLAGPREVAALTQTAAVERARQLRNGLRAMPASAIALPQVGVVVGRLRPNPSSIRGRGRSLEVLASWEDVVLAVMAPRAGKTTALAVPAILDAPGAVIATSNKADLWAATAALREERTRERVWVFDPQQIAYAERTWWWNPLRGVTNVEEAHRLAGHFVHTVRSSRGSNDFWAAAAHDLLAGLLLAAGTSGRDLTEVYEWLNDPMLQTPVDLLRTRGFNAAAVGLLGRMHGAPETRDGVYETARTATQCLRDDAIMAWVSPPARTGETALDERNLDELDAAGIAGTRQTVYLLSKEGAGAAAPLVAALTDRILRSATRAAESTGGRLDPPMVVVLDEAANVCRIADLPELYSHLGSRGIVPITILQSYKQGVRVWGEHGMDALWSAATIKLIGAGLDDARLAEDISRLVGDHDVPIRTITHGDRRTGESLSVRRQRILGAEQVRALPRGSALLLATGCKAALLDLAPWYSGRHAANVTAAIAAAEAHLTERAADRRALPPDL